MGIISYGRMITIAESVFAVAGVSAGTVAVGLIGGGARGSGIKSGAANGGVAEAVVASATGAGAMCSVRGAACIGRVIGKGCCGTVTKAVITSAGATGTVYGIGSTAGIGRVVVYSCGNRAVAKSIVTSATGAGTRRLVRYTITGRSVYLCSFCRILCAIIEPHVAESDAQSGSVVGINNAVIGIVENVLNHALGNGYLAAIRGISRMAGVVIKSRSGTTGGPISYLSPT